MTTDMLLEAIGMIDDEDIRAAREYRRPVTRQKVKWSLIAACLALFITFLGTAYAQGLISFGWIEKLFGIGEQTELLEGNVVPVNESVVSNGITLTIHSIVTDGSSVYADFSIDKLKSEEVQKNLSFTISVPNSFGLDLGGYSGGKVAIIPIENSEESTENNVQEYILLARVSGLNESLLGKTITLTAKYHEYHYLESYEDSVIESGELTNEWVFKIKLNDIMESVGYTMEDGTPVTVTPISFSLEKTNFFNQTADHFRVEMADGRLIDLMGSSSFEKGHIDENGNEIPNYKVSSIMSTEIINPNNVVALWVDDTRYQLIHD